MARILVVDDDAPVREAVGLLLRSYGHEVVLAEGGRAALAHIAAASIDLVIVDVFMPDMDGLETTKAIRALCPAVPIIVASGFFPLSSRDTGPPNFLKIAVELGASFTLTKPFSPAELLYCVDLCLEPGQRVSATGPAAPGQRRLAGGYRISDSRSDG